MHTQITVHSDLFRSISVHVYIGQDGMLSFDIMMGGGGTGMSAEAAQELIAVLQQAIEYANKRDW